MAHNVGQRLWDHALIRDKVIQFLHVPDSKALDQNQRPVFHNGALASVLTVNKATFESGIVALYRVFGGFPKRMELEEGPGSGVSHTSLHDYMLDVGTSPSRIDHYASKVRTVIISEPLSSLAAARIPAIHYSFRFVSEIIFRAIRIDPSAPAPAVPLILAGITLHLDPNTYEITGVAIHMLHGDVTKHNFLPHFLDVTGKDGRITHVAYRSGRVPLTSLRITGASPTYGAVYPSAPSDERIFGSYIFLEACTGLYIPGAKVSSREEIIRIAKLAPSLRAFDVGVNCDASSPLGKSLLQEIPKSLSGLIDLSVRNTSDSYWCRYLPAFMCHVIGDQNRLRHLALDLDITDRNTPEADLANLVPQDSDPRFPALQTLDLRISGVTPHAVSAMEISAHMLRLVSPDCVVQASVQPDEDQLFARIWSTEFNLCRELMLRFVHTIISGANAEAPGWRIMEAES